MMQEIIVERTVSLAWKLRRIAYAEEAALELDRQSREHTSETRLMFGRDPLPPITGGLALAIDVAARQEGRLDKLLELELKVQRAMQQAINLLLKLKKERPEDAEEEPFEPGRVIASDGRTGGDPMEVRSQQNEATAFPADAESAILTPSPGTPGEGWGGGRPELTRNDHVAQPPPYPSPGGPGEGTIPPQ